MADREKLRREGIRSSMLLYYSGLLAVIECQECMRLILLSSDLPEHQHLFGDIFSSVLRGVRSIAYVPSASAGCAPYRRQFAKTYRRLGIQKQVFAPLDSGLARQSLVAALRCEALYLSGGNTYYFLQLLWRTGALPKLRKFVKDGGVLIGVSAGSILMTPTIRTAGIPSFDCDTNDVGIRRLNALNLVPFEFSPHAKQHSRYEHEMARFSMRSRYPLYACGDGGAIVIDGPSTRFIGPIRGYLKGKAFDATFNPG